VVTAREGSGDPWVWMGPAAGEVLETYDPVRELRGRRRSLTREDLAVLEFAERTIQKSVPATEREAIADASLFVYRGQGGTITRVGWAVGLPDFGPIRT
jgi:hypothetical protein